MGWCSRGPLIRSAASDAVFADVTPGDASAIVRGDSEWFTDRVIKPDHPFYAGQRRLILANSGYSDPERVADYIALGGYRALLRAATELTPAEILTEVKRSGLRGRGGAGYPTGLKWELVARNPSPVKYVVCNADEGDPGAFMNRSVLEGDPHRVLEGMAIAGRAVGAQQGYIYARGESPLAIARIRTALDQAQREGLLGGRVFDSSFHFRIDLRIGAGAYVCGEETALLASIEGKRGQPVPRPPYPPESGLWGRATLINNVETFANIPTIIENGGEWFASIGTSASPGTKVFALAGRVVRTGLVEVPIGTPLRTILFDLGGGVPAGFEFKAAQTGGPAGGCIPAQYLDHSMDYDSLARIGTMMGSGGLIVMDTSSCMVDVARFFHGVLHGRIMRQVHSVPRRDCPDP
jgi:bidirectional [NiFe] hydrogenase diaphorase subunit